MSSRLAEWYRKWWTRVYARIRYGGVKSVETVSARSGEHTIHSVASDSAYIGQKTPGAETIIINNTQFEQLSELSAERVIEHEVGHRKRHPVLRGLLWGSVIVMAIGIVALALLLVSFSLLDVPIVPNLDVAAVLVGIIILGPVAVRLDEFGAELHVLEHMTEDEYRKAIELMPEGENVSWIASTLASIVYPNPDRVVQAHRLKTRTLASEE